MSQSNDQLLAQFEALQINPAEFDHHQHLQVAFAMLQRYAFLDALVKYANTINHMASAAGAVDKFNLTVTVVFLSVIAERLHQQQPLDFADFLQQNPDLLAKDLLQKWYVDQDLNTDFARQAFLMPPA